MIRLILCLLAVVLYLILTLPVLLVLHFIGKKHPDTKARVTHAMISWIFRVVLFFAGTNVTVIGKERIPTDTPSLFIGNHRSYFDILVTYLNMPYLTAFVAKIELKKIPIFRRWADNMKTLFLDRSNLKEGLKMILAGTAMLKGGESIMIFPEGTRSKEESDTPLLPFHDGSFKMAQKSGCPIVPVCINNCANIFEAHPPFIKKAYVVLEFGEPFYMKELAKEDQKHIGDYTKAILEATIQKNASLV